MDEDQIKEEMSLQIEDLSNINNLLETEDKDSIQVIFEEVINFNQGMKTLAANAYKMKELLKVSMEENECLMEWY